MRISYSKNVDAIVKVVGDIWGIEVGSQISGKPTVMKDLNVPSEYPWECLLLLLNSYQAIKNVAVFVKPQHNEKKG